MISLVFRSMPSFSAKSVMKSGCSEDIWSKRLAFNKTALKAVLYLAERNTRLRVGGNYIDNIKGFENSDKIEFDKAIDIVANMV